MKLLPLKNKWSILNAQETAAIKGGGGKDKDKGNNGNGNGNGGIGGTPPPVIQSNNGSGFLMP